MCMIQAQAGNTWDGLRRKIDDSKKVRKPGAAAPSVHLHHRRWRVAYRGAVAAVSLLHGQAGRVWTGDKPAGAMVAPPAWSVRLCGNVALWIAVGHPRH